MQQRSQSLIVYLMGRITVARSYHSCIVLHNLSEDEEDEGEEETCEMASEPVISALVVDDDPLLRCVHQAMLAKKGLQTKIATNGQEAVELFRKGASFNLVLTDMEMPIMDGIQATRELRSMNVDSVIVGITASDSNTAIQEFEKSGLNCCLEKPLTSAKVNDIMKLLQV